MPDTPALLHEFFLRATERAPDALAIDVPPGPGHPTRQQRTYAQLRDDARRVAAQLQPFAAADAIVAILLERDTCWLYAAQLGAGLAGCAYVGLEASFPDDHLRYVLGDAEARVVVTDAKGAQRLANLLPDLVRICVEHLPADPATPLPPPPWLGPDSLAYVIYTSGTTGRPKGVMIEHGSIVALVAADLAEFGLGPGDRIAQGSSPAYDSSVEEVWLALAAGATVVPLDHETVRLGPDLVPWLQRERITVLCPPPTLLRTTGCDDPAVALPELRLVYAGGEALPQDLADRWARGRRFVNGYGPTECTVTVVRGEVREGEPVAIGWPVSGSTAHVLDAELGDVAAGEAGELCIGGRSLARGYLRQPELTTGKFVVHPRHGRLYRTGDRARRGAGGALFYEGRLDAQVKLRGHRIELEEVESRLAALPGVREVACAVQGADLLVAYVVPEVADAMLDGAALASALRQQVPAHMVPGHFERIAVLPTTVGGKLDRKALPTVVREGGPALGATPGDELEAQVMAAFAAALRLERVGCDLDFFDLGGDSVRAAGVVSTLRKVPATAGLTVRDLYEQRTVQRLAMALRSHRAAAVRPVRMPLRRWPRLVSVLQAAWLLLELVVGTGVGYLACFEALPWLFAQHWLDPLMLAATLPFLWFGCRLLWVPCAVSVAVLGKWLLVGRYRAGRAPVYGLWYLRHWCVLRLVRFVPWELLQGTELQLVALRALGARIGQRVHLHRGVDLRGGGWDLLDLGDDVSVGQDAVLGLCELADGEVVFGPVRVGSGGTLEVRAGMRGHSELGAGACLTALSSLPAGSVVPAGERWDGVPARATGRVGEPPLPTVGGAMLGPVVHTLVVLAARGAAGAFAALPVLLIGWCTLAGCAGGVAATASFWLDPLDNLHGALFLLLALLLAVPTTVLVGGVWLRCSPRVPGGILRLHSFWHAVAIARTQTLDAASVWLSGTVFWPWWLRLAGARIGRRAEISTITDVLPEHLTIGDDCFLADGIYLGGARIDRGTVTVAPVQLGSRTFLGNHVVVPAGTTLPDDILLGVCTVADAQQVATGTAWFGQPPFALPRREVIEVDRRLTFEPGFVRRANRWFWELLRAALPVVPAVLVLWWWQLVVASEARGPWLWFGVVPAATALVGAAAALLVLTMKWLLLGRVAPGQHALWSCWCSRWDFLYVAWGFLARPVLEPFGGTLWLAFYLRGMGMRIGRGVVLGPGFAHVVDPDMLHFEDGATVDTMFQAHSFEDRVLKIAPVHVRAGASLGHATVVLYGSEIGAGTDVAPHSVVMKNERLPPRHSFAGVPVRPVG